VTGPDAVLSSSQQTRRSWSTQLASPVPALRPPVRGYRSESAVCCGAPLAALSCHRIPPERFDAHPAWRRVVNDLPDLGSELTGPTVWRHECLRAAGSSTSQVAATGRPAAGPGRRCGSGPGCRCGRQVVIVVSNIENQRLPSQRPGVHQVGVDGEPGAGGGGADRASSTS
jgi:hypothetical protein